MRAHARHTAADLWHTTCWKVRQRPVTAMGEPNTRQMNATPALHLPRMDELSSTIPLTDNWGGPTMCQTIRNTDVKEWPGHEGTQGLLGTQRSKQTMTYLLVSSVCS